MRPEPALRFPRLLTRCRRSAVALPLLIAACFHDSGPLDSGGSATGSTSSTTTTTTTTTDSTVGASTTSSTTSTTSPVEPTGSSTSTSTTTTGLTTTTTGASSTSSTSTGAAPCVDPGPEPNEDEAGAFDLGVQPCQARPGAHAGVLDHDTDVDWYSFDADYPGAGCNNFTGNPILSVSFDASPDVRLCVHPACEFNIAVMFTCPQGTTADTSPNGLSGCCGAGPIEFEVDCQGTPNESVQVLVRLDQAPADACVAYDLAYSFTQL